MSLIVDSDYNCNLNKFNEIAKTLQQQSKINGNKLNNMNDQEFDFDDQLDDASFKGLTGLSDVFSNIKAKARTLPQPPSPEKLKSKTPTPIISTTLTTLMVSNNNSNNSNGSNNGSNNNNKPVNSVSNSSDFEFTDDPFDYFDSLSNEDNNNNNNSNNNNSNSNSNKKFNSSSNNDYSSKNINSNKTFNSSSTINVSNNIKTNQFFSPININNNSSNNNSSNNNNNNSSRSNNNQAEFEMFEEEESLVINKKKSILQDTGSIDLTSPKKVASPSFPLKPSSSTPLYSNYNSNSNNNNTNYNSNNNNRQPIKKDYSYIINSNHNPITNRYKAIIYDLKIRKEELNSSKPVTTDEYKEKFIETTKIDEKIEELIAKIETEDLNPSTPLNSIATTTTTTTVATATTISVPNNNYQDDFEDFEDFSNTFNIDDQDFSAFDNNSNSNNNNNNNGNSFDNNNNHEEEIDYINLDDDDLIIQDSKSTFNNYNSNSNKSNSGSNSNGQVVFVDVDIEIKKYKGTNFEWSKKIVQINKEIFGFNNFRENQREIINSVLDNKDTFVLMPTGGGKSLCYQIPALYQHGITIVVSPLISLIEDQVSFLISLNYPAAALSSNVSSGDATKVLRDLRSSSPKTRLLYVTPERIASSESFMGILEKLYQNNQFSRIVIDEAHCVSQWGHDFRPDYKELSILRKKFKEVPILALTATATEKVRNDVILNLQMRVPVCFKQSFNRPNLIYQVVKKGKDVSKDMAEFIQKNYPDKSGIVYCLSKYDCEKISCDLRQYNIKADMYHAGLDVKTRNSIQDKWQKGRIKVIVATIAFGMGINKPDVRFVLHHTVPKSLEGYYQESGRAGRDGLQSHCMLYYKWSDKLRLDSMIYTSSKENGTRYNLKESRANLNKMIGYCENDTECRRALQLSYFGETFDKAKCNKTCDNCKIDTPISDKDVTKDAKEIVNVVQKTNGNETMSSIVQILRGSKTKKILELVELHNLKSLHGIKKQWKQTDIERVAHELILRNILVEIINQTNYGSTFAHISVGSSASSLLSGKTTVSIKVRAENKVGAKKAPVKSKRKKSDEDDDEDEEEQDVVVINLDNSTNKSTGDNELEQRLELLRQDLATLENQGENNIFPYSTISCLVKFKPNKIEKLNHGIEALPSSKVDRYGIFIINTIQDFINGKQYSSIDKSEFKAHIKKNVSTYLSVDPPSIDEDDFDLDINPDDLDYTVTTSTNSTSKRKLNNSNDSRPNKK